MNFLNVCRDHHMWCQNLPHCVWILFCQVQISMNLIHSQGVWLFDIFTYGRCLSPCQMPPLLSKAPHPATYPHYAIPTVGLNPSTWPPPLPHTTTPATCPHISTFVCVAPVSVVGCVYVVKVCVCVVGWWGMGGWVSNLLSSTIPTPKISKVICHQVLYTPKKYQSNLSSSTIPLKNISK